ncbi:MAG: Hint domain-containing protein, partial [Pararhodobacter sp.]
MADFLTTDFFLLSGVTFDGTTVSWESAISYFGNITIFDIGDSSPPPQDGNDSLLWYNGYTVNIAGYDYKLFQATGSSYAYIPYDIYVNDMSSFPPGPGSTSTYQPALTTAANCFLTGTRIATPASDVFVENLIIGDLVLTADGRAVP